MVRIKTEQNTNAHIYSKFASNKQDKLGCKLAFYSHKFMMSPSKNVTLCTTTSCAGILHFGLEVYFLVMRYQESCSSFLPT